MNKKTRTIRGFLLGIFISSLASILIVFLKDYISIQLSEDFYWFYIAWFLIGIGGAINIFYNRKNLRFETMLGFSLLVCMIGGLIFTILLDMSQYMPEGSSDSYLIFSKIFLGLILGGLSSIVSNGFGLVILLIFKPEKNGFELDDIKRIIIPDDEKIIGAIYDIVGRPIYWVNDIGNVLFPPKRKWPWWAMNGEPMPSNAIFFTKRRMIIMFIGMPEKGFSRAFPFRPRNVYYNLDEVKNNGNELIKTKTPTDIINSNNNNFEIPFEDIVKVKLKKLRKKGSFGTTFIIKTRELTPIRYIFLKKGDILKLEEILSKFLSSKAKIGSGKLIR